MNRTSILLALGILVCTGFSVRAGDNCCEKCCHCMQPKEYCPDCGDPCSKCRLPALFGPAHQQKLLDQADSCSACQRNHAVHKLGSPLHADFCDNPEVLDSLIRSLQCDTCWVVRKNAAWAICHQKARVPYAVVALYLASLLDPHYLVRDAATQALDILILCRKDCYRDLFKATDELAKQLKSSYQPTKGQCISMDMVTQFCAHWTSAGN